jgi:hypothetical protein
LENSIIDKKSRLPSLLIKGFSIMIEMNENGKSILLDVNCNFLMGSYTDAHLMRENKKIWKERKLIPTATVMISMKK